MYNLNSLAYASDFLNLSSLEAPIAFDFSPDFTKLFILDNTDSGASATLYRYDMSIAHDLSTATLIDSQLLTGIKESRDISLDPTGYNVYVIAEDSTDTYDDVIYTFSFASVWDVYTATMVGATFPKDPNDVTRIQFSPDRNFMYLLVEQRYIEKYSLSYPGEPSTGTLVATLDFQDVLETSQLIMAFTLENDLEQLFSIGTSYNAILQSLLNSSNDFSSFYYKNVEALSVENTFPMDFIFNNIGTVFYCLDFVGKKINRYDLDLVASNNAVGENYIAVYESIKINSESDITLAETVRTTGIINLLMVGVEKISTLVTTSVHSFTKKTGISKIILPSVKTGIINMLLSGKSVINTLSELKIMGYSIKKAISNIKLPQGSNILTILSNIKVVESVSKVISGFTNILITTKDRYKTCKSKITVVDNGMYYNPMFRSFYKK